MGERRGGGDDSVSVEQHSGNSFDWQPLEFVLVHASESRIQLMNKEDNS